MSELNREQIMKGLECCATDNSCYERNCPYKSDRLTACTTKLSRDVLALIKELTEENERLRGVGIPDDETYIKLSDAKHAIMAYIGEQTVSKYASSEECKAVRNGAEGAMNELDYLIPAKVAPIADTVRKMQERLKMYFGTYILGYKIPLNEVLKVINQIAKEMLEEG